MKLKCSNEFITRGYIPVDRNSVKTKKLSSTDGTKTLEPQKLNMSISVFWDVASYSIVASYRRFGRTCCLPIP